MIKVKASGFLLIFVYLCLMVVSSATVHAATDPLFTVQDVKIDVTAESAAKAREQAFGQAQMKAFNILINRLLPAGQAASYTAPDYQTVSTFVKDFEITAEQLSSVRYVGTYSFNFKNDAVRNYIKGQGLSYSDVSSRPVLILPFYQLGANTILWDDRNQWLKAWQNMRGTQGLVPVITPIGDLQDAADIDNNQALKFDAQALGNMVARYGAGEAIIMIAVPEWSGSNDTGRNPDRLIVNLYRTDRGRPDFARRLQVTPADAAQSMTIFDAAAETARKVLQDSWKQKTLTAAQDSHLVRARVRFSSMQEWVLTQKALKRVQGIEKMNLVSLKTGEAQLELAYQGDQRRLRLAMAQADISLVAPQVQYEGFAGQMPPVYELKLKR